VGANFIEDPRHRPFAPTIRARRRSDAAARGQLEYKLSSTLIGGYRREPIAGHPIQSEG